MDDRTPTGRELDHARKIEEARIEQRVRARLDSHQDEDTAVINRRAAESVRAATSSSPPRYKLYQRIIDRLPPWGLVLVLLALVAALVATGGTKLAGLW
jgi:hypothetical protein